MLHRFTFTLAYLSLGIVLFIATFLTADYRQPQPQDTISAPTQVAQQASLQRFAPIVRGAEPAESLTRENLLAATAKWEAARVVLNNPFIVPTTTRSTAIPSLSPVR